MLELNPETSQQPSRRALPLFCTEYEGTSYSVLSCLRQAELRTATCFIHDSQFPSQRRQRMLLPPESSTSPHHVVPRPCSSHEPIHLALTSFLAAYRQLVSEVAFIPVTFALFLHHHPIHPDSLSPQRFRHEYPSLRLC